MIFRSTILFFLLFSVSLYGQERQVLYGPVPDWVLPFEIQDAGEVAEGPFHFFYSDTQIHTSGEGAQNYNAYRVRLQTPEALALGNINLAWMPDSGKVTVHHLRVIREEREINVLDQTEFMVFQPEGGVEFSILSGLRAANIQAPGLRVGDIIEFAATVETREIALPDKTFGFSQIGAFPVSGAFRLRLSWEDGKEPDWQVTPDIAHQVVTYENAVEINTQDPDLPLFPEGAPPRFGFLRLLEYSNFSSWNELSEYLAPMFEEASRLDEPSPLKQLAASIISEHESSLERARAALKLVQDELRYVYVGMNGANLLPAKAEVSWDRRYGDCKAKTVLLMSLLSEMGIDSTPVLVSLSGGDGINERLPGPQYFDHVLVQAEIEGEKYWLDGTRTGDLRMRTSPPEFFRWVLPLTRGGADLTEIPFRRLEEPVEMYVVDIDASQGYQQSATFSVKHIFRGAAALNTRAALNSMPASEVERSLRQLLSADDGFEEIESLDWSFFPESATLLIEFSAKDSLEWEEMSGSRRWNTQIQGAGFYPPPRRRRTEASSAPWLNDPYKFSCYITSIRLPEPDAGWSWHFSAEAMDELIGGVSYWRMAELSGGTMSTVMSSRTVKYEISTAEAEFANSMIDDFDNSQSSVYQVIGIPRGGRTQIADERISGVPGALGNDWLNDASPCIPPNLR